MFWSIVFACTTPEPPPPPPDPAEAAEDLRMSTDAWRRVPDASRMGSVRHAVERGLAIRDPTAELDLALADAQANVLLDPLAALPRFDRAAAAMRREDVDHWLDALVRAGDLDRVAIEHERWLGAPVDLAHPLARRIAVESTVDTHLGWRDVVGAVRGARLFEQVATSPHTALALDTAGAPAWLESLAQVESGPWDVAVARPARPEDTWLVDGDRFALLDVAVEVRDAEDLRRPGVIVALESPEDAMLVVGSAGSAPVAVRFVRDRIVSTTDAERVRVWTASNDR